ncbi:hypothetical protein [Methylosinus sp. Ce-a6]|uniref:hypothetical protein n=1 Tax=Methylosinus sp. Ce-a6 TaxID=2172005 RepID=UPI00135B6C3A|nr:hypothetical protein [Methylosinus sp. Ce-a6]
MNKIVRRHYPAANLPEDLRRELDGARDVTITIETEEEALPGRLTLLEELFASRRPPFRTKEEIDEDLRRDRDDWDR